MNLSAEPRLPLSDAAPIQHALIRNVSELQNRLWQTIPLVRTMQVSVERFDGADVVLRAPLGPNENDKHCAFGGSLASVLTLAGWGLVNLKLGERGLAAEVFVMDSSIRYLKPVWSDFHAVATGIESDWPNFVETFLSRGKARMAITARLLDAAGQVCAEFEARFVAKAIVN